MSLNFHNKLFFKNQGLRKAALQQEAGALSRWKAAKGLRRSERGSLGGAGRSWLDRHRLRENIHSYAEISV